MYFATAYCIIICIASCESHADNDEQVEYQGAQVWRTELRGADDILFIKNLIDHREISIWNLSPNQADYLVHAANKVKINRQLRTRSLDHTVLIMDVHRKIEVLKPQPPSWNEKSLRIGHRLDFQSYPTLKIIDEYFNYLAYSYPSLCKLQTIGRTAENRTIQMLNISNGNPANKVILLTAGLHGREWIGITSALYIANDIITKFDQQPDFMKNKNWLIIPVVNPDGYEYTHTKNRLWRKNRSGSKYCKGVDVNRNFETDWNIEGIAANNPCDETYSGPFQFSEAESVALKYLLMNTKKKPSALVDLHSYGQLILFPWSARTQPTSHAKLHKETAQAMTQMMFTFSRQNYTFGPTYHKIYPATGALIDWAYASGVSQSFAIEARDTGVYGFLVPPRFIPETGMEILAAVRQLANGLTIFNKGRDTMWFK